jgi:hypothetical protein
VAAVGLDGRVESQLDLLGPVIAQIVLTAEDQGSLRMKVMMASSVTAVAVSLTAVAHLMIAGSKNKKCKLINFSEKNQNGKWKMFLLVGFYFYLLNSSRHPCRDLDKSLRSTISEKHVPMADLHM